MPRTERKQSKTGIYQVMLRGINKQRLFEDEQDYLKMLACLAAVKAISKFKLYAYCLMGNQVHFLIKEGEEPLGLIFRRLGIRYASWFNWKHKRTGPLFQDRFKSEPIESDQYFVTALLYIYQNPVKAKLCEHPKDYRWSSRNQLGRNDLVDEAELFDIVTIESVAQAEKDEVFCEYFASKIGRRMAISDEKALGKLKVISGVKSMTEFQLLGKATQVDTLTELSKQGASQRQLARLTGMGRTVIVRLCKNAGK